MRPRARFTVAFLCLQIIPIIAIGLVTLAYTMKVVIDEVVESSDLMTRQVYEQVRVALDRGHGEPATILQNDDALRELLGSMQAFGPAVVIARITDASGKILVAASDGSEGQMEPPLPSIADLEQKVSRWWPFAVLTAFSGNDIYATTRSFNVNGKPFGTIYVGVTTALLADRMRRLGFAFGLIVIADVILTLLATASLRRLLFQEMWPFAALTLDPRTGEDAQGPARQDELSGLAERFNRLSREVHSEHNHWETARNNVFEMVRSMHDGVVLLDAGGSLLFANREARSALGLEKSVAVEGRPLSVLLRRNHPLASIAEAALESGSEAQDVPLSLGDNGDPERSSKLLISFSRLGAGRKPVGLLILLRDLNAVRELETVVDYSNRLARLGGLISGVAHQLRSPLHGMNLRLELLREDASRGNDIEKHINRLRNEVERLDQSVEAMLRFMRPQELKLSKFVLNDLLVEIANRVKKENIRFLYEFASSRPVEADRAMLSEAFTNLIQNAMQAMPDGGVITITTAERGGTLEVEITDRGTGIAPEILDQILNLYFTTKKGGSGLGLPLALRAIELNRGALKIESHIGEGTTCRVRLPTASDAPLQIASIAN